MSGEPRAPERRAAPRTGAAVQSVAQLRYATWLDAGAKLGFVGLALGFAGYVFGLYEAQVALAALPELWDQPLAAYLERSGTPTGWAWLAQVHRKADLANLGGIALLAGASLLPLAVVIPIFFAARERTLALVCAATFAVVALSASGLLAAGH